MAGLFGGLRKRLNQANQPGGFTDRLAVFGAQLQDIDDGGQRAHRIAQQRAAAVAAQQRAAALQSLAPLFGGGGQSQGQAQAQSLDLEALASGNLGPTDSQMGAQAPRGLSSLRDAAPVLARAAAAGVDIGDYMTLLDKAGPDMALENGVAYDRRGIQSGQRIGVNLSNVNGTLVDTQNPENANRFVPQVGEGMRVLYDENGNPVVVPLDGYTTARGGIERTVSDARNASQASYAGVQAENAAAGQGRGSAPYDLVTVQGPDGRPITTSRQSVLQTGGILGQSAADQAYAVDSAKNRAAQEEQREERASAAVRMLPTLDRMEQLLPDIIAGQGAGIRRTSARFAGTFLGSEEAARRAASTEVFENEARQVVAQIIGTFGANPTEGERKYAEQMAGADVNLTPQALQEGIRLARARAARDIGAAQGGGSTSGTSQPRRINSRAEYQQLPSGATFIAPDGSVRRKP